MSNNVDTIDDYSGDSDTFLSDEECFDLIQNGTNVYTNSKSLSRYENRINLSKYEPEAACLTNSTVTHLLEINRRQENDRNRIKDKSDRATVEQVLDPRTRIILFKLINRRHIEEINGCISTGKEANVYHSTSQDGIDKAIKIYKTSILTFKDRDKYVTGEFRFRHGYCRHNPRKMVRTWAEKEMRNLSRIHQAGLLCPQPFLLKGHVLVMSFMGINGIPSPLLKDVDIKESKARQLYLDCVIIMYKLFKVGKLIHADLSEYNLILHQGKLCIIDVSQSVEWDHPRALEFLRKDCINVNDFFRRKGVPTMTSRELFDFITDPNVNDNNIDEYLSALQKIASKRTIEDLTNQEKIDEEVFKSSYIPQRLDQVIDCERDIFDQQKRKESEFYQTINGLKKDFSGPVLKPSLLEKNMSL